MYGISRTTKRRMKQPYNRVLAYFDNDLEKTVTWFRLPNPMFGGLSPLTLIKLGREDYLKQLILTELKEK